MKNFYQLNDKIRKKIDFDIVIIGAGLSGLSLAIEISKRTKFSVLLLEKKKTTKGQKLVLLELPKKYLYDEV